MYYDKYYTQSDLEERWYSQIRNAQPIPSNNNYPERAGLHNNNEQSQQIASPPKKFLNPFSAKGKLRRQQDTSSSKHEPIMTPQQARMPFSPYTCTPIMQTQHPSGSDRFYYRIKDRVNDRGQRYNQVNFNDKESYDDILTSIIHEVSDPELDEPRKPPVTIDHSKAPPGVLANEEALVGADIGPPTDYIRLDDEQKFPPLGAQKKKKQRRPVTIERQGVEAGWDDEMRRFYHDSWGGENFSITSALQQMPRELGGFF